MSRIKLKRSWFDEVINFISELEKLDLFSFELKDGIAKEIILSDDKLAKIEFLASLHDDILENEEISEKNKIMISRNFNSMFFIAINE